MWNDPIVEEIRRVRLEIEVECDFDLDKLYLKALDIQKSHSQNLIVRPFVKRKALKRNKKLLEEQWRNNFSAER